MAYWYFTGSPNLKEFADENLKLITTQCRILMHQRYITVENIARKGEIACNKQFLLFLQCFLPYMAQIFNFKCILKCHLQFVSIWTSLKFCCLVMVTVYQTIPTFNDLEKEGFCKSNQQVTSIFSFCHTVFYSSFPHQISIFWSHIFCCLQMLSILTSPKFCCLVKS